MSAQITPHVCQFCETPLRDHWWDPCTYTPTVAPTSSVTAEKTATGTPTTPSTDNEPQRAERGAE